MYEGDFLSIDGNDGGVYAGQIEVMTERPERELAALASWPDRPSELAIDPLQALTPQAI